MISITITAEEDGKKVMKAFGGDYHSMMNLEWSDRISDMISDNFDDNES